eukprot:2740841-Rhodomonas_salina.3
MRTWCTEQCLQVRLPVWAPLDSELENAELRLQARGVPRRDVQTQVTVPAVPRTRRGSESSGRKRFRVNTLLHCHGCLRGIRLFAVPLIIMTVFWGKCPAECPAAIAGMPSTVPLLRIIAALDR